MTTTTTLTAAGTRSLSRAGLGTVLLGAALAPIDMFIVNVALPTIDADLHASTATLQWIVAGYGIAFALLLVVGGRLGDAFGRRRLFVAGLSAFTVTSLACGIAPGVTTLVIARVAQGAAAAMMVPQALSIIQATTTGEHRARTLGYYGATGGIAMVVGQLLGGVLVTANVAGEGWRPIFLVNVPIGILGVLLAMRTLPETRATDPIGIDRAGTPLLGLALLTLLIPLMEGRALGWPVWCWVLIGVFPFAVAAFVAVERRLEARGGVPLLPMSLLSTPAMRRGLGIAAPFFTGFGGFLFVYALTLQDGLHLGPLGSGLALTPMAVAFLVASLLSSRLVARIGHRVVVLGLSVQLLGLLTLVATVLVAWPHVNVADLAPGTLITGAGQGLVAPTMFRVILSRVPAGSAGAGSGVLTTTQQTFLALGVATLGTLFATLSVSGYGNALVTVTLVQAAMTALVAVAARRLPDPRG
ncbi:MFS transporter [Amycolatopsis alkalitolerans]|uniref:MFS transporter n=1 Tax=Amycolatopsis alkalitolerans TaxID=2547244 RepID=A0A5C4M2W1_9PSEU|nr:MFS transporter [Amycolatopsis alkalitolerans]TNC27348.1 MFS transporter [Amycolatopsis alkalitolerans]